MIAILELRAELLTEMAATPAGRELREFLLDSAAEIEFAIVRLGELSEQQAKPDLSMYYAEEEVPIANLATSRD